MPTTMFEKIVRYIRVLSPMCKFETPEILCNSKELFVRRRYEELNKELEALVNLKETPKLSN